MPVDAWFENGFEIRRQKIVKSAQRDRVRAQSGSAPASTSGIKFSADAKARNLKSVIRKAPEVMVKVTGSSSGLAAVKRHLDYISRNGEIELENECGEPVVGRADLKALREQLKAAQIPNESKKREFLHVIFSMPKGTPEKPMRQAVSEFCKEEFANRRYVMAFHDDTEHTHMHVCVGTRDIDRADVPRLSPRKADLFRWRQGFADKLRENGVDAAASERRHRFKYRKPEHPVVRQIQADNPRSPAYNAHRDKEKSLTRTMNAIMRPRTAFVGPPRPPRVPKAVEGKKAAVSAAVAAGARPLNPAHDRIEANRLKALAGWQQVVKDLEQSGDVELAKQVRALLQEGEKPVRSGNQELYDAATAGKNRDESLER